MNQSKKSRESKTSRLFVIVLLAMSLIAPTIPIAKANPGWLEGWDYRKSHKINGTTAGAQTDYQVKITVHYGDGSDSDDDVYLNSKCRTDFGDVRFTNSSGNDLLDYWIEEKTDSYNATIWIEGDSIPDDPDSVNIYIYYGKADETTTSDHVYTMIRADDGVSGNFTEDVRGTASLTHASGSYTITENSDDDAFASGMILPDWAFMSVIRVFEPYPTDTGSDQVFFGLFDEDVVSELCADSAVVIPKTRFWLIRYQSTDDNFPNYIAVVYLDTLDVQHFWDGDTWVETVQRISTSGNLEVRMWSDGTDLFFDAFSGGVSVFNAPAQIAISSVKAFSSGRCMVWAEPYTSHYYVPQSIDRYFVRKYVDPEPEHGAWGEEEEEIFPPSVPNLLFGAGFNASSPYVELHWNHSLVDVQFFEVQNSSDAEDWTYLGQSTNANYTDSQVVNGTERYYRVRACNQTGGAWYNSSWTDVNFEKVYFIPGVGDGVPVDDYSIIFLAIGLIMTLCIAFLYVRDK